MNFQRAWKAMLAGCLPAALIPLLLFISVRSLLEGAFSGESAGVGSIILLIVGIGVSGAKALGSLGLSRALAATSVLSAYVVALIILIVNASMFDMSESYSLSAAVVTAVAFATFPATLRGTRNSAAMVTIVLSIVVFVWTLSHVLSNLALGTPSLGLVLLVHVLSWIGFPALIGLGQHPNAEDTHRSRIVT